MLEFAIPVSACSMQSVTPWRLGFVAVYGVFSGEVMPNSKKKIKGGNLRERYKLREVITMEPILTKPSADRIKRSV